MGGVWGTAGLDLISVSKSFHVDSCQSETESVVSDHDN